jgi:hypothetical protein
MAETASFPSLQSAVTLRTTPMKMLSTLTAALLITGAAFAATAPAASAPTATPATQVQPAQKHNSAMHCEKQAREKKLTGEAEKEFVKECREGKKAN